MKHHLLTALFVLATSVAVAGCAGVQLPAATQADADRAQQRWPGTTTADLDKGRSLYRGRCANCHQPVEPHTIAATEWPEHVDEMKERAGLADDEADLVVRYLVVMSERGVGSDATASVADH